VDAAGGSGSDVFWMSDAQTSPAELPHTVDGGAGNDVFKFNDPADLNAAATVSGGDGIDEIQILADGQTLIDNDLDRVSSVEKLTFADGTNTVTVGPNAEAAGIVSVTAGSGNDNINASGYSSAVGVVLSAGDGNDTLRGGAGDDLLLAGAGDDSVMGNGGSDTIYSGTGDDFVDGGAGDDVIWFAIDDITSADVVDGGTGTDTLALSSAGSLADVDLTDFTGIEKLTLANGANVVELSAEAKQAGIVSVVGGTGADSINASTYSTTALNVSSGGGADNIQTAAGADTIDAGAGNDTIAAGNGANDVIGGAGDDSIVSGTGNDTIDAGAGNDNVSSGTGNDVIIAGSGSDSILAGAGEDDVRFAIDELTSADTVGAGDDADTLTFTSAGTLSDSDLTNVTSSENLVLAGGTNAITLGAEAMEAGIVSVVGGTGADAVDASAYTVAIEVSSGGGADYLQSGSGNDSITSGDGADTIAAGSGAESIVAGDGNDVVQFAIDEITSSDDVDGGNNTDTLSLTEAGSLADADLTNVASVEVLELADGTNTIELGATHAQTAGIVSVVGGTGADSIDASSYTVALNVASGAGADDIQTGSGNDIVDGGAGNDTVASGSGNDSVSAGSGDDSIVAGAGNDTIAAGSGSDKIDAGANDDTLQFAVDDLTSSDTVGGGNNTDTLELTTSGTLQDLDMFNVTSVENLVLAGGTNNITLGDRGEEAGIVSVVGGTGADAINASAYDTNAIEVASGDGDDYVRTGVGADTVSAGDGADTVVSGSGADTVSAGAGDDVVNTGAGNDTILAGAGSESVLAGDGTDVLQFAIAEVTVADTVAGEAGNDHLILSSAGTLVDADLTNFSSVEFMTLADGTNTITLGAEAQGAGLVSVNGGTGADAIDASDYSANIEISAGNGANYIQTGSGDDSVTTGTGADTIAAGAGAESVVAGSGDDLIQFAINDVTSADVVGGDAGTDTLQLTTAGALADVDLTNFTSIENLVLADGTNTIELGAEAKGAGIVSVVGGTGADSINAASVAQAIEVIGGAGDDHITTSTGNYADTINAGTGNDTVSAGDGADTINAGAGDDSVLAGAGNDTVLAGTGDDFIDGGNGVDVFQFAIDDVTSGDTVTGGTGNDHLILTTAGTLADADLTNFTLVEYMSLADGSNNITLGAEAQGAGLVSVNGGTGADTIDASSYTTAIKVNSDTGSDYVLTGTGNDTVLSGAGSDTIGTGTGNDSINAGADNDTILFAADAIDINDRVDGGTGTADTMALTTGSHTLTDADFTNTVNVERLVLADAGGVSVTLDDEAYNSGSGFSTVVSGSGADTISTFDVDVARGTLVVDLGASDREIDVVNFRNEAIATVNSSDDDVTNGGGILDGAAGTSRSIANGDFVSDANATTVGAVIGNFESGDGGDRFDVNSNTGTFVDNYVLGTANATVAGLATGGVIEIASSSAQVQTSWTLSSVAELLSQNGAGNALKALQDGEYTVVLYDGTSSAADAYLFQITVDDGDGFDLAYVSGETEGGASGADFDNDLDAIEFVGRLVDVGADTLTAQNIA
jgi:Ca2+-binding RTX toxin-like protein